MPTYRQLVFKRCECSPYFAHALICSSAPINAEDQIRADLSADQADENLKKLKDDLRAFMLSEAAKGTTDISAKIKVVINIHGYNMPLKSIKEGFEQNQKRFKTDTSDNSPDDYVLFVDYYWPSERILLSQWKNWLLAMPYPLLLIFALAIAGVSLGGFLQGLGLWLLGFGTALIALRLVVYFRDRDRATNHGVYDAVELVRWLLVLIKEQLNHDPAAAALHTLFPSLIKLSILAHSMGCFVATQTVRMLSDVFEEAAIARWKELSEDGPFGEVAGYAPQKSTQQHANALSRLGNHYQLKQLILVAPDIPIWAVTTGRSNYLLASMRRFEESFLFVNDADIVLRLASTLANYFVFPSRSKEGGYRLGNLSIAQQGAAHTSPYGESNGTMKSLVLNGLFGSVKMTDPPFHCPESIGHSFNVVSCTDYTDVGVNAPPASSSSQGRRRRLSGMTARHPLCRIANYVITTLLNFIGSSGVDSHGGYFQGKFCLGLIYSLALHGEARTRRNIPSLTQQLKELQLTWLTIKA